MCVLCACVCMCVMCVTCACVMCVRVCDVCARCVCVCVCVCVPLHTINTPLFDMGIRQRRDKYHGTLELVGLWNFWIK